MTSVVEFMVLDDRKRSQKELEDLCQRYISNGIYKEEVTFGHGAQVTKPNYIDPDKDRFNVGPKIIRRYKGKQARKTI